MKVRYCLILFGILLASCASQEDKLLGKYVGFHSETLWEVVLLKGHSFTYNMSGHAGDVQVRGKYAISGDTLFLNSFAESSADVLHEADQLYLMEGDSCLVNIWSRYDLCKSFGNQESWASNRRDVYFPFSEFQNLQEKRSVEQAFQLILDDSVLAPVLDHSVAAARRPLVIKSFHHLDDTIELTKFNKRVQIDALSETDSIFFLEVFSIYRRPSAFSIVFLFSEPVELAGEEVREYNAHLRKDGGKWVIRKSYLI